MSDSADLVEVTETITDNPSSTILVADDSVTIRASLIRTMPSDINILEAVNGEDAWETLQTNENIDLVISDLDMPRLNGYELLQRMRSAKNTRLETLPVIILTGSEDTNIKSNAFIAGASDFVPKKFDKVELLARIRVHQKLAQTIRELEKSRAVLSTQANTDPLTGLLNRRSYFEKSRDLLSLMERHSEDFSVIMLDLDHFKNINDTYGHQAGDYVLKEAAKIYAKVIRDGDILARIGGEEFVIAAPYSNLLAALVVGERLRKAIELHEFVYEGKALQVSVSIGIADRENKRNVPLEDIMAIADERLYLAKKKGRNKVCASDNNEKLGELADTHPIRPKLDTALQMVDHGNIDSLISHLPYLMEKIIPLLKMANEFGGDELDMEIINRLIKNLRSAVK